MLRALTLAAFLLLSLLWAMNVVDEPEGVATSSLATDKAPAEAELGVTARVAVTGGTLITVTTNVDELNNDGDCSLREAIEAATTDSTSDGCPAGNGGDTVTLPPATYVLTQGQLELTGMITVQGTITATLEAQGWNRVLYIHPDAIVTLLYLDITNGRNGGPGGGIANYGSTLIVGSTIHGNSLGYGGGHGGGIYNEGNLTLTNSTVSNNTSGLTICLSGRCGENGDGGGIYNSGILDVGNSTLSGNQAGSSDCFFSRPLTVQCSNGGDGGGIYNARILTVSNSTLSSNSVGSRGCTPNGNCSRRGKGGGLYNVGTLTLDNSTVTNNVSEGVYNTNPSSRFKNNIIAGNSESGCSGTITSLGNNLIQSSAECSINGDYIHWAPLIGPLQDNGGPTLTHALNKRSPAIDAGDCTDSTGVKVTLDQRGELRPQRGGCDIGAYEFPYTSTFTISDTSLPLISR